MTMTPNKFTLNSDYLSIAQVSSKEFTAYFGGGALAPGAYIETSANFTVPGEVGAIDQTMISLNGSSFRIASYARLEFTTTNPYARVVGFLDLSRTSATNLRARLVLENASSNNASYPALTFRIKVSSFKPPNVF